jgi:hypothetical protein
MPLSMAPSFCLVPSPSSRSGPLSLVFRPQLPAQRQRGVVPHCFLRAHAAEGPEHSEGKVPQGGAEGPTPWGRRSRKAGPKVPQGGVKGSRNAAAEGPTRWGRPASVAICKASPPVYQPLSLSGYWARKYSFLFVSSGLHPEASVGHTSGCFPTSGGHL